MKIQVLVEIEAPDGATHYGGNLNDEPTWYKCSQPGGYVHRWYYNYDRKGWFLACHGKPIYIKEIPTGQYKLEVI